MIKEFFSAKNKFFWINIATMLVAVILILFFVFRWMDTYTRHGQAILVPDAKGMNVYEANALFVENNLHCLVADSVYVKDKPAGSVLDHNPQAGQKVKRGRTIYLTVNTRSIPLQMVPDVADNSSHRQAEARIIASGFKLTEPEMISGERDWVYAVKYKGKSLEHSEKVPVGAVLTLVVGNGSKEVESDSLSVDVDAVVDDSWFN